MAGYTYPKHFAADHLVIATPNRPTARRLLHTSMLGRWSLLSGCGCSSLRRIGVVCTLHDARASRSARFEAYVICA